jgi:transposase-like protein
MAELLADFVMEAEVTAKVGAEAHERAPERTPYRNGHRDRRWDARLGTLQMQVPKAASANMRSSCARTRSACMVLVLIMIPPVRMRDLEVGSQEC